jgi:predicted nucleic acid-binding protein
MYMLDTNVVITLLQGEEQVKEFLVSLDVPSFALSSVSHFEVLVGAQKEDLTQEAVEEYLQYFTIVPIDQIVSSCAARLAEKIGRHRMMHKDLLIAATSIVHEYTLLTYDQGFKKMKGIDVKVLPY